jgi:aspartate--ammonia ligase
LFRASCASRIDIAAFIHDYRRDTNKESMNERRTMSYRPLLGVRETERAIKEIKDFFQLNLATELNLTRVTAPLFVLAGTGINDDLNGVERPVSFPVKALGDARAEVVHSLAKWKRLALAEYDFKKGFGLYTDMNAIRADENLDAIHSLYVDQWDWERVIDESERNLDFLKMIVRKIYAAVKRLEFRMHDLYPILPLVLPEDITFIHAEDALARYPGMSPREREDALAKEYGAVFIIGIGGVLADGRPHDGRAPDYDDWSTPTTEGHKGLNGDILVWNEVLGRSFELSSMGIRVDIPALERQLEISGKTERKKLFFHKELLAGRLPLSIGGGIGQSRLCMYMLRKAHIGEIQVGLWPESMREECAKAGIPLL